MRGGSLTGLWVVGFARSIFRQIQSAGHAAGLVRQPPGPPGSSSGELGGARIRYSSDGRSGRVHYQSREADFSLYYEFGGGDVIACIDLPSVDDWQRHTGLPPDRREAVIHVIGRQVARDQTTGGTGSYRVNGDWLEIVR
ncbi:MAG: hypothetical protein SFV24_22315 [Gemmatimonadales bacterium]|nr:hypothetical protein [Gemmatimonadales bacterium]